MTTSAFSASPTRLYSPDLAPDGTRSQPETSGSVFDKGSTDAAAVIGRKSETAAAAAASVENEPLALPDGFDLLDWLAAAQQPTTTTSDPDPQSRTISSLTNSTASTSLLNDLLWTDNDEEELKTIESGVSGLESALPPATPIAESVSPIQFYDIEEFLNVSDEKRSATTSAAKRPRLDASRRAANRSDRRQKNNAASKRSREIRKGKQAQMVETAKALERDNAALQLKVEALEKECREMKDKLVQKLAAPN